MLLSGGGGYSIPIDVLTLRDHTTGTFRQHMSYYSGTQVNYNTNGMGYRLFPPPYGYDYNYNDDDPWRCALVRRYDMQYLWPQKFLYALFVVVCNFSDSGHSQAIWNLSTVQYIGKVPLDHNKSVIHLTRGGVYFPMSSHFFIFSYACTKIFNFVAHHHFCSSCFLQ